MSDIKSIIEKCAIEISKVNGDIKKKSIDNYNKELSATDKAHDEQIVETIANNIIKQSLGISGYSNIENLLKDYILNPEKRKKIDEIITKK